MLRNTLILIVLGIPSFLAGQATVHVSVILNKPDAGGLLRVALSPDAQAYNSDVGCTLISVPANGRVVTATFENVNPGTCAVKVFHDVNSDNELNTNWVGWPKEPYGFSNDAPVNMGSPPFKLAAIEVKDKDLTTRIVLR